MSGLIRKDVLSSTSLWGAAQIHESLAHARWSVKEKNDAVTHTEIAREVNKAIMSMNIKADKVMVFVSDSASVLKAAFKHVLQGLYPHAIHVTCLSHSLNNVGKAMVGCLSNIITQVFEWGPPLLHAKCHAARRRRWFAFLKSKGQKASVPPKHLSTRWVIWQRCADWWIEQIDLFHEFFILEKARYKVLVVPPGALRTSCLGWKVPTRNDGCH